MRSMRNELGVQLFVSIPERDGLLSGAAQTARFNGRARMKFPEGRLMLGTVFLYEREAFGELVVVDLHPRVMTDLPTKVVCHLTKAPVVEVQKRLR